ncbi:MAG: helix-turn-helix domain-containing protein, partial [Janthinobacterium lividum]
IGTANGDKVTFEMPLTLSQIGNLIGLTPVHVSFSMKALRGKSFVATFGRSVLIYKIVQLRLSAKYGPGLLH